MTALTTYPSPVSLAATSGWPVMNGLVLRRYAEGSNDDPIPIRGAERDRDRVPRALFVGLAERRRALRPSSGLLPTGVMRKELIDVVEGMKRSGVFGVLPDRLLVLWRWRREGRTGEMSMLEKYPEIGEWWTGGLAGGVIEARESIASKTLRKDGLAVASLIGYIYHIGLSYAFSLMKIMERLELVRG